MMLKLFFVAALLIPLLAHAAPEGSDHYFSCRSCHGDSGLGSPAIHAPALAGQSTDYLVRQLRHFRIGIRGAHPEDKWGQQMALMAANLDEDQIVGVAQFIAELPPWPAGKVESHASARIVELYSSCALCHGDKGQGNPTASVPRIGGLNDVYLATQMRNFRDGRRGFTEEDIYGKQMRDAMIVMDDTSIDGLARYIASLGGVRTLLPDD
ncbi:MAG: c-type cytochrome [Haliea sp.]|jgi:cytochrome c553|nr:c-type cytochrome [Haliea sp.]